jgi:preprotein translocase subunit SecG
MKKILQIITSQAGFIFYVCSLVLWATATLIPENILTIFIAFVSSVFIIIPFLVAIKNMYVSAECRDYEIFKSIFGQLN